MYQPVLSPHAMIHVMGSYQANGQFVPLQNHAFFASSPTNIHQDLFQFSQNTNNHNKRVLQQGSYSVEFLQHFNMRMQNGNCNVQNGVAENWQRLNLPNHTPVTPQRMHTSIINSPVTPVQNQMNYRPMSADSAKKQSWNHNNKLGKRHSYQDLPLHRESYNSSDSGFSSRSPTPNKHYKSSSTTESSDEHESLSSVSESRYRNRITKQNNSRGNLSLSSSTSNLTQDQRHINDLVNATSCTSVHGHQSRRKNSIARTSPTSQRLHRGKKFNGTTVPEANILTRYPPNPVEKFLHKSYLIQTKQRPNNLETGSVYDKLSKAIWEKFEQNQLTQSTYCHKMYLWRFLFFYIKSRFPQFELFMVGSTLNGFGSDGSDVDLLLLFRDAAVDPRNAAIFRLNQIMSCLKKCEYISCLELIQAKVPILRIRDKVYNLDVDMNYNNVVTVRNTHLLSCYSRIDWRVRPLVLVVKMWAQCQNINNARDMTISSYSLVLMVIHFLQCGVKPAVLPCLHTLFKDKFHHLSDIHKINYLEELFIPNDVLHPRNTQTLGELLIKFFEYYNQFDYDRYAISVRVASKIPIEICRHVRSPKNEPHQWKYLCIEEPFDFTNTARSVYDPEVFQKIKDIFKQTHQRLKKSNNLSDIFTRLEVVTAGNCDP